jgi:hypothetical protein
MFLSYIKLFDSHSTWYLRNCGAKTWIFFKRYKWLQKTGKTPHIRKKNTTGIYKRLYCNHSQPFTSHAKLFDSHLIWYLKKFWGKNVNFLKIDNCWKQEKLSLSDKYAIVICKQVYYKHLQRFHHISSCLIFIQFVIWEIFGQKRKFLKNNNCS